MRGRDDDIGNSDGIYSLFELEAASVQVSVMTPRKGSSLQRPIIMVVMYIWAPLLLKSKLRRPMTGELQRYWIMSLHNAIGRIT